MGPIKRARRAVDDEPVLEARVSSSFSHRESRKRARLSSPGPGSPAYQTQHDGRSSSPSEVEGSLAPKVPDRPLPPSTQHEIDRDAGFAHLENPDLDDARATQKLLKRSELLGENHAAENGVIESVTMTNFMCHDRLHVTLGPLINFITGKNGSGKSAILTAITLCLGGKASTTNRGGSLRSFIKEGRDSASLIINIKNQGVDAYQPDIYGETIIVERHFTKAATSGFKLKNAGGRIVSNKRADVEEIIEYFQMQIDNPMSVLTQDNARQFITSSTPAAKYRFFVKGVQLEQLDNDYRLVSETADAMSFKLEINKARVDKLRMNEQLAKEKAELVNKHTGMRTAVKRLGQQSAWAQVENEERNLEDREKIVSEAQGKIDEAQRDVDIKDQSYQQTNEASERAAESFQIVLEHLAPLKDKETEAKVALDSANQEVKNIHLEHRQIKDCLKSAESKVKGIQEDIRSEQRRIEDANGGGHARKLDDLETAEREVVEATTKLEDSSSKKLGLDEDRQLAVKSLEKMKTPIETKQRELSTCENQLQGLNRDVGQIMAGFDQKMPRLLNMIRDDQGFREKPVGPIGLHIKLLKPIWSNVLETSIGGLLSGFIVTSKADQLRLSGILRRVKLEFCPVVIGNNHPIDTTGHEPDEQYDTVLRVLEIDNDLVRRQLVINQAIEQTILVERRTDAMRILYDDARPRNVKQCFCLHDRQRGYGIRLGYALGSGDPSSGPIKPTGRKPRMKTDIDSQIAYQKETLRHLRIELQELESRQRELQQTVTRSTQAITSHKRKHEGIKVELQRAEEKVERLREELERDNVEDGRLEAFKQELREAKEEVELHGGSYGEAVLAKERQNLISLGLKTALDGVRGQIAEHEAKIRVAESKSRRIQQARQIALQEKNIAIDALNEAKAGKEAAEMKRDRQAATVIDFIKQASKVCPRIAIDPGDTAQSIDAKLAKFTAAIRSYNQRLGGTDDEILQACATAVKMHQDASSQLDDLEKLFRLLKQSYLDRLDKWRRFQRFISARSRSNFTYFLSERGFRGKLMLDHEAHLLDVHVEPDETTKSGTGRATKTLSGGEKSFSSICLLLSVWEAMGAPLRCLDEFDVFMDHVNRDVSTNMIIAAARRSVGRQFILITPLAIGGSVKQDRDVKFIRLEDPRQQRLADL